MPFCANCDEWFEGQNENQAACEHCHQINPLEIIANQDEDPETKETIERRLIQLDRFTITGFNSRDGGLRFARIQADHCGLKMQRLLGA